MIKTLSIVLAIASTTLFVGCTTTENFKAPTDSKDALIMLEDCVYSTRSHDERLIDSLRYFHQQESKDIDLNFDFVKNELNFCRTGEDLY